MVGCVETRVAVIDLAMTFSRVLCISGAHASLTFAPLLPPTNGAGKHDAVAVVRPCRTREAGDLVEVAPSLESRPRGRCLGVALFDPVSDDWTELLAEALVLDLEPPRVYRITIFLSICLLIGFVK